MGIKKARNKFEQLTAALRTWQTCLSFSWCKYEKHIWNKQEKKLFL